MTYNYDRLLERPYVCTYELQYYALPTLYLLLPTLPIYYYSIHFYSTTTAPYRQPLQSVHKHTYTVQSVPHLTFSRVLTY
jgi:hypothetical protein